MLERRELERLTRDYWEKLADNAGDLTTNKYIEELLPREIEFARKQNRISQKTYEKIIFLAGHSLDPILQSILVYCPESITFIMNNSYGVNNEGLPITGKKHYQSISYYLEELKTKHNLQFQSQSKYLDKIQNNTKQTATVFQTLASLVRTTDGVIIDITGAKKSMVAAAFLFASFSDVDVSYVDFDDDMYDAQYRRPYGFGCIIKPLETPYQTFSLRQWETLRKRYNGYRFQAALDLVKELREPMEQYLHAGEAMRRLQTIISCYKYWDEGDYNRALALFNTLDEKREKKFTAPGTVLKLGKYIVTSDNDEGFKGWPDYFFVDNDELRAYLCDELARIHRLLTMQKEYRSVLLRAGSINEVVMLARLVRLLPENRQQDLSDFYLKAMTPTISSIFHMLKRNSNGSITMNQIKGRDVLPDTLKRLSTVKVGDQLSWLNGINRQGENALLPYKLFLKYRNKLAHLNYASPEDIARKAYEFIQANIRDFLNMEKDNCSTYCTTVMPWEDICSITGLKEYLPISLVTPRPE